MSSKRGSESKDKSKEAIPKKKYKTGAEKRIQASKKGLAGAGTAPGQQKLWQPKSQPSQNSAELEVLPQENAPLPIVMASSSSRVEEEGEGPSLLIREEEGEQKDPFLIPEGSDKDSDSESAADVESDVLSLITSTSATCNPFNAPDPTCNISVKLNFMKSHPVQPLSDASHTLPFQAHKVYFRLVPGGSAIQRKWLSFCADDQKLYCSTCMAFCTNRRSMFISGWPVNKLHVNERVKEHEESALHQASVISYMTAERKSDIETLINVNLVNKQKEKIRNNRLVIMRLIDIIQHIAKLGLAYRGQDEAAHSLLNRDLNHGNFLELVLLLSKYDSVLQNHVKEVVALSEERKRRHPQSKGRGGLVTFLSKTTINNLIILMGMMVKQRISQEVTDAVKFSVEMDSTQDVGVMEQCSIILRYVRERDVHERLIALINVKSTTGEALYLSLKEQLEKVSLSVNNIIGCSFDGAAKMSGCYNGVQAHIRNVSCSSVYTWCYAHILNLVIMDITQCVIHVKSLFGLLEKTACFFSESYKRLSVWTEQVSSQRHGQEKLLRLKKIGDTRWWSKPRALSTIFGSCSDQSKELYSTLIYCLEHISLSPQFDSKVVSEAKYLIYGWTRYETLLVSFLFMQIFEIATPVSDYLQTSGLDILQAWRMVEMAKSQFQKLRPSFAKLVALVNAFIEKIDHSLDEMSVSAEVEKSLPQKRVARKKRMPGELARDEPTVDPLKGFEVHTYYAVIDQAVGSIDNKFSKNEKLIQDLAFLDPRQFSNIKEENIPAESFNTVADLAGVDSVQLKSELLNFKDNYPLLKKSSLPQTATVTIEESDDDEEITSDIKKNVCENCLTCCYRLLYDYNLHSAAYTNLFAVYKTLLTLACTQVSCERVFSKLKIVKTRLRSMIGQELLESFLLINIERDIANNLVYDDIIDNFAKSSSLLQKLLI
uniref:DUF4371 domain-containing protein n=1 Tax=Xenopus tropicalis TaxID=8364 RepID=A0A803KFL2_XENTR